MLPDRSLFIGHKLVKNAKIQTFKCDIFRHFQTLCRTSRLLWNVSNLFFPFSNSFDLVTSICKIRALNAFLWIFAAWNFCFPQNRIYYVAVLLRSPWLSVGIHIGLFSLLSTSSFVMETDSRLTHCGRLTFFVQKVKNNQFSKAERGRPKADRAKRL